MDLSILEQAAGPAGHCLLLKRGSWASTPFATDLSICDNPCCGCTEIDFWCTPDPSGKGAANAGVPWCFALDVRERRIAAGRSRTAAHPQSGDLAQAVVAELTSEDWNVLLQFLVSVKRRQIEHGDLRHADAQFPDELLEDSGTLVGYIEIFPFDAGLTFECGGEPWFADDQYCVNPRCTCTEPVLTLCPVVPASSAVGNGERRPPAVRYDYESGAIRMEAPTGAGQPPLDVLVAALRACEPTLHARLKKRHARLRLLFRRALRGGRLRGNVARRRTVERLFWLRDSDVPADVPRRDAVTPLPSRSLPKAGRNDPCPCGSNKKFKKCCGRA
jgi:hypothetical protein